MKYSHYPRFTGALIGGALTLAIGTVHDTASGAVAGAEHLSPAVRSGEIASSHLGVAVQQQPRPAQRRPAARQPARTPARTPARAPARAAPRPTPVVPVSTSGRSELAGNLGTLLEARTRGGDWGVLVVSLNRGDTLYSRQPDTSLLPASTMKLFTAALALDQYGSGHRFSTDVLHTGRIDRDGVVRGDLVLRGDGDPGFSQRFLPGGPSAPVEMLAELVAGAGVRRVQGNLIADATAFDTTRVPEGWQSYYLHASYAARVSALSMNENLLWVVVKPSAPGQPALVSLDPASHIPVSSAVNTTARSSDARVAAYSTPTGSITVRGWIGAASGERRYSLVVEDPVTHTAGAFQRALAARGIIVDGEVRVGPTPRGADVIASMPSQPLDRLIAIMNRESSNHFAELLFRNAGRTSEGAHVGSAESTRRLLRQFLVTKVGVDAGAVYAADGSGLSVLNRVTPRSLVQLLAYAHRAPWSDTFHASLPVAGESETLRNRMRQTAAQGNLHAKTGTTNTVISLAGYVTARDGDVLAFAFVYNGADRWNARATIDDMSVTLAGFAN